MTCLVIGLTCVLSTLGIGVALWSIKNTKKRARNFINHETGDFSFSIDPSSFIIVPTSNDSVITPEIRS